MPLYFFYTMVQKSKMTKNSNQGVLPLRDLTVLQLLLISFIRLFKQDSRKVHSHYQGTFL